MTPTPADRVDDLRDRPRDRHDEIKRFGKPRGIQRDEDADRSNQPRAVSVERVADPVQLDVSASTITELKTVLSAILTNALNDQIAHLSLDATGSRTAQDRAAIESTHSTLPTGGWRQGVVTHSRPITPAGR